MTDRTPSKRTCDLADFDFVGAAFEVRYDIALLLWDRAGLTWTTLRKQYPGLDMVHVEPNNIAFTLDDKYEFRVQLDRAFMTCSAPTPNLEEFNAHAEPFLETVVKHLEISDFTRVGHRQQFNLEFKDMKEAADTFLSFGIVSLPAGDSFNIKEGATVTPEVRIRWEGESRGAMLHMHLEERQFEFTPPLLFKKIAPVEAVHRAIILDLDQYTRGTVAVGQLKVGEWVNSAAHAARRDCAKFFRSVG